MAVPGDHAPRHAVPAGRQQGQAHLQEARVSGVHPTVATVDPTTIPVLDTKARKERLDRTVEPDPDLVWRFSQRRAAPRLGAAHERMGPGVDGQRQKRGRNDQAPGERPAARPRVPPREIHQRFRSSPTTSYGLIMSLSSCSRMWQWKTYRNFWPALTGVPLGRSNFAMIRVTSPGSVFTVSLKAGRSFLGGCTRAPVKTKRPGYWVVSNGWRSRIWNCTRWTWIGWASPVVLMIRQISIAPALGVSVTGSAHGALMRAMIGS